jgi:hypothetical protein
MWPNADGVIRNKVLCSTQRRITWSLLALLTFGLVTGPTGIAAAPPGGGPNFEVPLEIVGAGISSAEDDPFVSDSFRFMPGEFLYFVFQLSGYQSEKKGEDSAQVRLEYTVELVDAESVPLTAPAKGVIEEETSAKDKDWLPKRRVSFQLPALLAAGGFTLRMTAKDDISKASTTREFPFQTGGHNLTPGTGLAVQRFLFYRTEQEAEPLDSASFRAGDTVWARFDITGFKTGPGNRYQLEYGVAALKPDGSVLFKQEKAAELASESFYPAQFVPGILSLTTTRKLIHTEYSIILTVRDLIGKQTIESQHTFRIE